MSLDELRLRASTELRDAARRMGLLKPLISVRSLVQRLTNQGSYEAAFDHALTSAIRPGDVVWDVGANVGLYTTKFSELVGSTGEVVAFEPVPSCYAELTQRARPLGNVRAFNLALGKTPGSVEMNVASNPLGATHSLVSQNRQGGGTLKVEVACGDEIRTRHGLRPPNVLKIDVEGFEEEVIEGLSGILADRNCRAVLCEVHFAILASRGEKQAPARIVTRLREKGFGTTWTDSSHLAATR